MRSFQRVNIEPQTSLKQEYSELFIGPQRTQHTRTRVTLGALLFPISFNWLCLPSCVDPAPPPLTAAVCTRHSDVFSGRMLCQEVWRGGQKVTVSDSSCATSVRTPDLSPLSTWQSGRLRVGLNAPPRHVCHAQRVLEQLKSYLFFMFKGHSAFSTTDLRTAHCCHFLTYKSANPESKFCLLLFASHKSLSLSCD